MPSHQCPTPGPSTYYASYANIATNPRSSAFEWIPDSGASHYITSNLDNFSLYYPYSGHVDVLICDGNGLSISHIGSLTLHASSISLTLDNVFCVLAMKINLISIS